MSEQAEKPVVLIVDDSKVIRRAAVKMLCGDYDVREAEHGLEAWTQIQHDQSISVVFTDLQMPEMNGLQLLDNIRDSDDERINALPIIMITGADDTEAAKKQVFEHGATDFISKPFDSIDLLSRAQSYARLTRKVVELEKQSGIDKLTGLLNANSFIEHGNKTLSFAQRHHLSITVVQLEIEDFQNLFLAHGKHVAQQVIQAVAKKLSAGLRTEDDAARTGVARFSLLLPLTSCSTAKVVVQRMREAVNNIVFDTGSEKLRVALVAGICAYDVIGEMSFADLESNSEVALGMAQEQAVDKFAVYAEEEEKEVEVSRDDLLAAFEHLVDGDYYRIPDAHIEQVMEKVSEFMQFADERPDMRLTASGDGI